MLFFYFQSKFNHNSITYNKILSNIKDRSVSYYYYHLMHWVFNIGLIFFKKKDWFSSNKLLLKWEIRNIISEAQDNTASKKKMKYIFNVRIKIFFSSFVRIPLYLRALSQAFFTTTTSFLHVSNAAITLGFT